MNYAMTRVLEFRVDAAFGIFRVSHEWDGENEIKNNALGFALRPDIQLNWGSIYTLSLGFDVGLNFRTGFMFGAHISPLSFRFGAKREFLLNFQAGIVGDSEDSSMEVLSQLSYLLL